MTSVEDLVAAHPMLEMLVGLVILTVVILVHGIGVRLVYRHFTRSWERAGVTMAPWRYNVMVSVAAASLVA